MLKWRHYLMSHLSLFMNFLDPLLFYRLTVSLSLSHWYSGSGVVLDCIDSWSLHPYLLWWWAKKKNPLIVWEWDRKLLYLGITIRHHLASLVIPIGDPRNRFVYPNLTLMMDYILIIHPEDHRVASRSLPSNDKQWSHARVFLIYPHHC